MFIRFFEIVFANLAIISPNPPTPPLHSTCNTIYSMELVRKLGNVPMAAIFWALVCVAFFVAGLVTGVLAFRYVGWGTFPVIILSLWLFLLRRLQLRTYVDCPQYAFVLVWLTNALVFQFANPDTYLADITTGDTFHLIFLRKSLEIGNYFVFLIILLLYIMMVLAARKQTAVKQEKVIGSLGTVKKWKQDTGMIALDTFEGTKYPHPKKKWKAYSSEGLDSSDRVRVTALDKKRKRAEVVKASEQDKSHSCSTVISETEKIKSRNLGYIAMILIPLGIVGDIMDFSLLTILFPIGAGAFVCSAFMKTERKTDSPISASILAGIWLLTTASIGWAWFLE